MYIEQESDMTDMLKVVIELIHIAIILVTPFGRNIILMNIIPFYTDIINIFNVVIALTYQVIVLITLLERLFLIMKDIFNSLNN